MAESVSQTPLALRLVGSPRVTVDGRAVAVGSRKALALLAVLALDGTLSRARLAALLWPDHDDGGARRNLRREVFRLRSVGVAVDDDGEAHALTLAGPFACDALAPTHGPGVLLDGFDGVAGEAFADWLLAWRGRLMQRGRVDAVRAAAEHADRGEWAAALALHLAALDADPSNESAAQHALRIYARQGDRDAALALFARLESQLRQRLGLAPLPATRELLKAFVATPAGPVAGTAAAPSDAAPAREAPDAAGRAPLPSRAPFAGRAAEQAAVRDAWAAGRAVFVSGPPGIGKSRLAAECAAEAGASLFVRCHPDDTQLAYSSAVRALRELFDAAPDVELPDWATRELTRLLPELGPAPADASEAAGDEARMRLFEAYAQAWLLLADANFNVIVLDDWQFADAASLQLWGFVDARARLAAPRAAAGPPLRRLVAFRSGELPAASLAHMRSRVDGGEATLVPLDGLPLPDVQTLVQRLAGQSGALLFAQRLHGATAGNPLFVLETIRHLFDRQLLSVDPAGGWRTPFDSVTSDYAELPVPPSARETLLARAHALGEGAARLLQAASLAGDSFDIAILAGTSALDEADSVVALERAEASQIVRVGDDGAYRFVHDLHRQCLADSVSPARRALAHARLARNLEAAGGVAARIARHYELGGLERDAAPWFVRAGEDAARVFDLETALAHYGRAVQLGLDAAAAYTVRDRRLLILHRLHRTEEQLRELTLMAELAARTGDTAAPYELASKRVVTLVNGGFVADALAHARWVADGAPTLKLRVRARYMAGVALMHLCDDEGARRELEAALAQAPAALPDREPMICAFLCHVAVNEGTLDAAERHLARGLASAAALDLPLARADLLNAGYRIAEAGADRPAAIARLVEANALSIAVGDVTLRINYLFNLAIVLLNGGDVEGARARRLEVMGLLGGKSDPKARFIDTLLAGRLALHDGDLGRAWTSLGAAVDAAVSAGEHSMQRSALVARAQLAADCGDAGLVEQQLTALAGAGASAPGRIVVVAEALRGRAELIRGDAAGAVRRLQAALDAAAPVASDPDRQENRELAQATLAAAAAACGDVDTAIAAARDVRFAPRLQAMALAARLGVDAGPHPGAAADVDAAGALLDAGSLAPLEALHLRRALADHHRRRGDPTAADRRGDVDRRAEALAATLPGDDPATASLGAALRALATP